MTTMDIVMMGAGIAAASGCMVDASTTNAEQTEVAGAELAAIPDGPVVNTIGEAHVIRLANTNLCLQPLGGSTGDVVVELRTCIPVGQPGTVAQHWLLSQKSSVDFEFVNLQSGKCLYNGVSVPVRDGAGPFRHENCNVFGTTSPASNALWRPTALRGEALLQSRIQHRDSGFCIDTANEFPFDGLQMVNWHCANVPVQTFIINRD